MRAMPAHERKLVETASAIAAGEAEFKSSPVRPVETSQEIEFLRLVTVGSVDDGKSTLIGRLLYDVSAIPSDQLSTLSSTNDVLDFARLTDGLRAERQQGITIDVAHRYWQTRRRRFILADAPGHKEYTKNMVTAASNADVAIVVVDARLGILEQTCRHLYIGALLGLRHIVICVNKMDLVGFQQERFDAIRRDWSLFSHLLRFAQLSFIPISALHGDNVVNKSNRTPWYLGPSLLQLLESLPAADDRSLLPARLPVQLVIRDQSNESRLYTGQIASGQFARGDEVVILPSGKRTHIKSIHTFKWPTAGSRCAALSCSGSRGSPRYWQGDLIVKPVELPSTSSQLTAILCWMDESASDHDRNYVLKHGSLVTKAKLKKIDWVLNIDTLTPDHCDHAQLVLNQIGSASIATQIPLSFDTYADNKYTGAFILIDDRTGNTAAAGMITDGKQNG